MRLALLRAALFAAAFAAAGVATESRADPPGHWHGHGGYPHFHPFHGHTSFFIGGTFWPFPPPYGYGPVYVVPRRPPEKVYVERFDGNPTPRTRGEIFCPNEGAYYPEVKRCPGGWQRVMRPPPASG